MPAHETSLKTYISVFAALIALTALTVGLAYVDLGAHWNDVVALVIAALQAALGALFFMHLRENKALSWLMLGTGLFWLLVLIAFAVSDVATRGWLSN